MTAAGSADSIGGVTREQAERQGPADPQGQPDPIAIPAHGWRIDPGHAVIAAALCWAGFAVVALLVMNGHGASLDSAGLRAWRSGAELGAPGPAWLTEQIRDITALGGVTLRNLIAIGAISALLFLRLKREALLLAATIMGGWAAGSLLKLLVGRPRPDIVPHLMEVTGHSFPSGHSFNAAVVFIALGLAFAALSRRRAVRWTIIGSAVALSLLIALSRVLLGVHYPSDVLAGWLGGAGWAFLATALLHRPAKTMAGA